MTSKDEEAETKTIDTTATSIGSTDTDSTLVEGTTAEESIIAKEQSKGSASPASVLGKRSAGSLDAMEVDESTEVKQLVAGPSTPTVRFDPDVEMMDASQPSSSQKQPPPLPPRKREVITDMMFGAFGCSYIFNTT